MTFEFATAQRVLFGPGMRQQLPGLVAGEGTRVFVIIGGNQERYREVVDLLKTEPFELATFSVSNEPDVSTVGAALEQARAHRAEAVVGVGGGSVIDTGKAVAALLTNPGKLFDYLEVIGDGHPLRAAAAPYFAVPTTAGTGSESTRNAVIGAPDHKVKVSMRSALMLPKYAVVDPELTLSSPARVTATAGLDACTQLIESFVGIKANPVTDGLCREGLILAGRSLRTAHADPNNLDAREDMSLAALMSGIALANAGLGAVHGFAGPLGGMLGASHGALCARLLAPVTRTNLSALRARQPGAPTLARYEEAARLVTGEVSATADDLVRWAESTASDLSIESLSHLGMTEERIPDAVAKARASGSMKGNPIELTGSELAAVLRAAL